MVLAAGAAGLVNGCGGGDACDPTQAACGNPPVSAHAGTDRDIAPGATVTLDASGSNSTNASVAWRQIAGPPVGTLSGPNPAFTAPDEVATLRFEVSVSRGAEIDRDTVAVWVLEDPAHAYWVGPAGNDANAGTRAQPFATVQAAIEAAHAAGNGGDVYIAAGDYTGSVTLRSRVSLYGGFDASNLARDLAAHRPTITSEAVAVKGTVESLTLEGLRLVAANATAAGGSSIAVHLHDSRDVLIRRTVIVAGDGGAGRDGAPGAQGGSGFAGVGGAGWEECPTGGTRPGGPGGLFYLAGGAGGAAHVLFGEAGADGAGPAGGSGGIGAVVPHGRGLDGRNGELGAFGANGDGGPSIGSAGAAGYDPPGGTSGGAGAHGSGGGGGGGSAGFTSVRGSNCGIGGGGGGGGGERGGGGHGGGGGGASIGVLLTGTTSATIAENSITTGTGGMGGEGGRRGAGGVGGAGYPHSAAPCLTDGCIGFPGRGGDGGLGGQGGHGGGGGGGPSIGVARTGSVTSTVSDNEFTLGGPGAGGSSPGNAGAAGRSGEHVIIP